MDNKINIYLDDVRSPLDKNWIVVRNYEEFVSSIVKFGLSNIETISLDHDLGETAMIEYYTNVKNNSTLDYNNIEEKTGYDCCLFLVNYSIDNNLPLPMVYVHSANPVGSINMISIINNFLKNCGLPETCCKITIPHSIDMGHEISPELRKLKWDRSKK